MFQDYDLLTTESEETTLWDGREWRIHYWKFKPELREIMEKKRAQMNTPIELDPFSDIYGEVTLSEWGRNEEQVINPKAFTNDPWKDNR